MQPQDGHDSQMCRSLSGKQRESQIRNARVPQKGWEALGGTAQAVHKLGRGGAAEQHKCRKGREEEGCSACEERGAGCICVSKAVKGGTAYACLQAKEGRKV